jgi:hypothetical protein
MLGETRGRQSNANEHLMNFSALRSKTTLCLSVASFILVLSNAHPFHAQTPHKKAEHRGSVEQELVRTETGFFEAWKMKDQAYFREHIADDGIFWGDSGTSSRVEQLQEQEASAKACNVQGYGLSDFGVLPIAEGAYLLTYKAEQYATCNGERVPIHMNGSSIYIFKAGHWQAIYRAEVALKNQS